MNGGYYAQGRLTKLEARGYTSSVMLSRATSSAWLSTSSGKLTRPLIQLRACAAPGGHWRRYSLFSRHPRGALAQRRAHRCHQPGVSTTGGDAQARESHWTVAGSRPWGDRRTCRQPLWVVRVMGSDVPVCGVLLRVISQPPLDEEPAAQAVAPRATDGRLLRRSKRRGASIA